MSLEALLSWARRKPQYPIAELVAFDCTVGRVFLRRPIVNDLYDLDSCKEAGADELGVRAFLVARHVCNKRGEPLYVGLTSVDGLDAAFVLHATQRIEALYDDCTRPRMPPAR